MWYYFMLQRCTFNSNAFVGIRQLQCILLKVALLFGVEIRENTSYVNLREPEKVKDGICMLSSILPKVNYPNIK